MYHMTDLLILHLLHFFPLVSLGTVLQCLR
jgi:hypothetical protein